MKKIFSVLLATILLIFNYSEIVAFANEEKQVNVRSVDITPPEINLGTLEINQKEAKQGDTIKISFEANDESKIEYISVNYKRPLTGDTETLVMKFNDSTGKYEGTFTVHENIQNGTWKVDYIWLTDELSNRKGMYSYDYDLSALDFTVEKGNEVDIEPPELNLGTLEINQKEAKQGDTIKISFEANDESKIEYISVNYKRPLTGDTETLVMKFNGSTGKYEETFTVHENIQNGTWKVDYIWLTDELSNRKGMYSYDYDLSALDFTVEKGNEVDIEPPELNLGTLEINQKEAKQGDTVKISFEANDESKIEYISVNYKRPLTGDTETLVMKFNDSTGKYEGTFTVHENIQNGTWKVDYIWLTDELSNRKGMYSYDYDLSALDFTVIEDENPNIPLDGVTVVKSNESWTNKVINGDLYIGPEAVLTVYGNVNVTGNIYVFGALKSYGGLSVKGALYGTNMVFGGFPTLYNGTIVLNGTNSIAEILVSNNPVDDIPVRIDSSLNAVNGKLDISGTTIDVADMFIGEQKVGLDYFGRFNLQDFEIGRKQSLNIKFGTIFGYEIIKTYKVINDLNVKPVIQASDVTLAVGDIFNPIKYINAIDEEDGDIIANVEVAENNVDTSKEGQYKVTYKVSDSQGLTSTKTIIVSVVPDVTAPLKPSAEKVTDQTTSVTGTAEAGSTISVKVGTNEVGTGTTDSNGNFSISIQKQTAGTKLFVTAKDQAGNASEVQITTVEDATAPNPPIVNEVTDQSTSVTGTAEAGSTISVTAGTNEVGTGSTDGNGNFSLSIQKQTAGTELSVTAKDQAGNASEAQFVIVKDATAPNPPIVNEITDQSTSVTGTAEIGSNIHVIVNINEFWTGSTDSNGNFSVSIQKQTAGTEFYILATDRFGNMSDSTKVTVSSKLSGWVYENGLWYYYDASNKKTGWLRDGSTWYYLDTSGAMKTGWVKDRNKWYYMDASGTMKTGWVKDRNKWYYMDASGTMKTGWVKDNNNWYYLADDGKMLTGWQKVDSAWYYLYEDGIMASNTKIGNYYVAANGMWLKHIQN